MNAKFPIIVELSREGARRTQVERPDELAPEGGAEVWAGLD
jgi:hypothetical protein